MCEIFERKNASDKQLKHHEKRGSHLERKIVQTKPQGRSVNWSKAPRLSPLDLLISTNPLVFTRILSVIIPMRLLILTFFLSILHLGAQETTPAIVPAIPAQPKIKLDHVRVTVLGYHMFSEKRKVQKMVIRTSKFRQQMQAIKDLDLNVISLEDFTLWKAGKKSIPDRSILITIDDGWKSVYTDAYPVLKEFGYPFTIYLYTNFLNNGGRTLTHEQIEEMMQNGCSIGSHSVSHPLPSMVKRQKKAGSETYTKYLNNELGTSKKLLEKTFKQTILSYVYPGGHHDEEMEKVSADLGYQHLFTCLPGKTTRETENHIIPRYIILGQDKYDYIFNQATTFKATTYSKSVAGAIIQTTAHPVLPKPGARIPERMPTISADLSAVENIDPDSIIMRISGFGQVPLVFNPEANTASWKINRPLRILTCDVSLQWKLLEEDDYQKPMRWTFVIDKEAAYSPKTAPQLP